MRLPKLEVVDGAKRHFSAGAIIEHNGKFLLMDRVNPPYGFAGPAGHVDEGETPEEALRREVAEETGLRVSGCELLYDEFVSENTCVHGVRGHHWYVYRVEAMGDIVPKQEEAKSMGWYSRGDMQQLSLEPVWRYWFTKYGVLESGV